MTASRTLSLKVGSYYTTDEGVNVEPAITVRVLDTVNWAKTGASLVKVLDAQVSELAAARSEGEPLMPGLRPMTPDEVKAHLENEEEDERD